LQANVCANYLQNWNCGGASSVSDGCAAAGFAMFIRRIYPQEYAVQNVRIGLDKCRIVVMRDTSSVSDTVYFLKKLLERCLGIPSDSYRQMSGKKNAPCFWSKDFGVDFKIVRGNGHVFEVEFQSAFFCFPNAYGLIGKLIVELYRRENAGFMSSILELHIAQDFIDFKTADLFPQGFGSDCYVKRFKCVYRPFIHENNSQAFYLNDPNSSWGIIIYDKSKELKDQQKDRSLFKNEYYRKLGYFDQQVTRVELKINSKICRKHTHNFLTIGNEVEFCKSVLKDFYKGHRIYELSPGMVFDEKNPSRNKLYPLWQDIFDRKSNYEPRSLKEIASDLEHYDSLTIEEIEKRLVNLFARFSGTLSVSVLEEVVQRAKEKARKRDLRYQQTKLKQQKLINELDRDFTKILPVNIFKSNEILPNTPVNSFWVNSEQD
jgi:hypothetical protein